MTFCLIPGDGVGKEVIPAAAAVVRAVLPAADFVDADAGWECFQRRGTALPQETFDAILASDGCLFGATQSPSTVVAGYRSPILELRKRLELFTNLRPARRLLPGGPVVDLLTVRENTEGLYSGRERREGDTAIAERVITRAASERIARAAFEQAESRRAQRPTHEAKVTIVHKANVLKLTDGLFRSVCLEVAAEYPEIRVDEMLVDAAAMNLVRAPEKFDVLVTTNLFGDILSDLTAGLIGGLGMAPSANVGNGPSIVCEPVHGSAPDIAGRGIANPIGAILSAAMMLDHVGRAAEAERIRCAVQAAVRTDVLTPDAGGAGTTATVVDAILRHLDAPGEVGRSNG